MRFWCWKLMIASDEMKHFDFNKMLYIIVLLLTAWSQRVPQNLPCHNIWPVSISEWNHCIVRSVLDKKYAHIVRAK